MASPGISALSCVSLERYRGMVICIREALDQRELVDDLAALVGDMLLCIVELGGWRVFGEGDLWGSQHHTRLKSQLLIVR